MKTRSGIFRKAFAAFLLAALTLGVCAPVLASSGTATLTTRVPSHFSVEVTIQGNGAVTINGVTLTQSGVVSVERGKAVAVQIEAGDGDCLKSVTYNHADVTTAAAKGSLTLPAMAGDAVLTVTFAAKATNPNTGDAGGQIVAFCGLLAAISLLGMAAVRTAGRKAGRMP